MAKPSEKSVRRQNQQTLVLEDQPHGACFFIIVTTKPCSINLHCFLSIIKGDMGQEGAAYRQLVSELTWPKHSAME